MSEYRRQCPVCKVWNRQVKINSVKRINENTLSLSKFFYQCGHTVDVPHAIIRGSGPHGYIQITWYARDNNGNIFIKSVPEQRAIWEQGHGELPKDWMVHHINRVRNDNRLENLIAMPRSAHNRWL